MKQTPFYHQHLEADGKLVDFAGWAMPIHYGSQLEEHQQVRQDAGLFDVSHMTIVDINGSEAAPFLRKLLANDIDRLKTPGKALYSCMLNPEGGVIDDLICYYLSDEHYRLVVNAATREKDVTWLEKQINHFEATMVVLDNLAMIAVQGPNAIDMTIATLPESLAADCRNLKPFSSLLSEGWFIGRTGYTGEDGFEIMLPQSQAADYWTKLLAQGIKPCGLGARDTLRLEAGMNLYGNDMDETTSPLESNLGWTIALSSAQSPDMSSECRDFIGRAALKDAISQDNITQKLVGIVMTGPGIPREGYSVMSGHETIGTITSGSFSPTLKKGIAFARVDKALFGDCTIAIRNKQVPAMVVTLPFVRKGETVYKPLTEDES